MPFLSRTQPFCDGAHRKFNTGITPLEVKIPDGQQEKQYFCLCRQSKTLPYCDGTHRTLPASVETVKERKAREHKEKIVKYSVWGAGVATALVAGIWLAKKLFSGGKAENGNAASSSSSSSGRFTE